MCRERSVFLQEVYCAVEYLIAQRSNVLGISDSGKEWVYRDPLLQFLWPILWYGQKDRSGFSTAHPAVMAFWSNAALYIRRQQTVTDLLERLPSSKGSVALLKGMALVESLYPNPGLRRMGDIDLLVPYEQFGQVADALLALGWRPREQDDGHLLQAIWQGRGEPQNQIGEWSFIGPARDMIDLHWHLVPAIWLRPAFNFIMSDIWTETIPLDKAEWPGCRTLNPEQTLAYLCLHLGQHGLQFLHSLLDIDLFIRNVTRQADWQWNSFFLLVEGWRVRSVVYHVLLFSQALYNTPLPEGILERLDPGWLAKQRISKLLQPSDLIAARRASLGCRYPSLVKFMLIDRGRDIAKAVYKILNPGTGWLEQRYGRRVSLFHHWRHVGRVMLRGD